MRQWCARMPSQACGCGVKINSHRLKLRNAVADKFHGRMSQGGLVYEDLSSVKFCYSPVAGEIYSCRTVPFHLLHRIRAKYLDCLWQWSVDLFAVSDAFFHVRPPGSHGEGCARRSHAERSSKLDGE